MLDSWIVLVYVWFYQTCQEDHPLKRKEEEKKKKRVKKEREREKREKKKKKKSACNRTPQILLF